MYQTIDAHALTIVTVAGSIIVTPFYVFAADVFSGASRTKGFKSGRLFCSGAR